MTIFGAIKSNVVEEQARGLRPLMQARCRRSLLFTLLMIAALALRLIGLNKGLWLDEADSVRIIGDGDLLLTLRLARNSVHPPLYFALLKGWRMISETEVFLRLFSVLLSMGTLFVLWIWMRKYSIRAAFLAVLYFATAPVLLRFSQEIRPYSLLIFATSLSFLFASRLISRPDKTSNYALLSLSWLLAVSTHLAGILLIAPVSLFMFLGIKDKQEIHIWKALLALIMPLVAFVFSFFVLRMIHDPNANWMPEVSLELIYRTSIYFLGFFQAPAGVYALSAAIFVLLFFGEWRKTLPFLAAGILFWLEVLLISLLITPIYWYRIFLPSLVPLIGFASLQLVTIRNKVLRTTSYVFVILLSICYSFLWINGRADTPVEGAKQVANYLQSKWKETSITVFYPDYTDIPVLYHFRNLKTNPTSRVRPGSSTNQLEMVLKPAFLQAEQTANPKFFLIIRADSTLLKDRTTFPRILSVLNEKVKKPFILEALIIHGSDRWIRPELSIAEQRILNELHTAFGKPQHIAEHLLYHSTKYEIQ